MAHLRLGPEERRPVPGLPGWSMRVHDGIEKCVVFLGYEDPASLGGFKAVGTAYVQKFDNALYLVTVKHVALLLGSDPFDVRINRVDGGADLIRADFAVWHYHPDSNVDLAVIPFGFGDPRRHDVCVITANDLLTMDRPVNLVGIGDFCYTIGLFRLLTGERRNLPVVHTGHIALIPGDEKIPVKDWDSPDGNRTRHVEGYLVESLSLQGLSESPVFARVSVPHALHPEALQNIRPHDPRLLILPQADVWLLGVWQGAWDARPSEVIAVDRGGDMRVPVGIGVVVPATKLVELLNTPELTEMRAKLDRDLRPPASLD